MHQYIDTEAKKKGEGGEKNMTMVSKNRLLPKNEERVKDLFFSLLTDIKNKNEMIEFLSEFLTPTEKIMLSKRLAIAILLAKDWDFRNISRFLKVSTATILSVNTWIFHRSGGLKKQVLKILNKEKGEEARENFLYGLTKELASLRGLDWKYTHKLARDRHQKHIHAI